jgi:hypothetical protein
MEPVSRQGKLLAVVGKQARHVRCFDVSISAHREMTPMGALTAILEQTSMNVQGDVR